MRTLIAGRPLDRRGAAAVLAAAPFLCISRAAAASDQAPSSAQEAASAAAAPDARETFDLTAPLGTTGDGKLLTLEDLPGRAVVACFWASWCPHCRSELPVLERIQQAVSDEHLRVVLINTEVASDWRRVRRHMEGKLRALLTHDSDGRARKAFTAPNSVPFTVVVGRDGKRRATLRGWSEDRVDWLVDRVNAAVAAPVR